MKLLFWQITIVEGSAASSSFFLYLKILSTSSDETSSSGGNETDLFTTRGFSAHCWRVTDMLLITTTMRMVHWVHGHTSDSWPGSSSLCLPSVVWVACLADWLVSSSTTGDDSDHSSAVSWHGSSGTWGKSYSWFSAVFRVTDNSRVGAWSSGEGASVTSLTLAVWNNGSFRESVNGQDIANRELSYSIINI